MFNKKKIKLNIGEKFCWSIYYMKIFSEFQTIFLRFFANILRKIITRWQNPTEN